MIYNKVALLHDYLIIRNIAPSGCILELILMYILSGMAELLLKSTILARNLRAYQHLETWKFPLMQSS